MALADAGTQWRIILTDVNQRAIAVGRLPRIRLPVGLEQPGLAGLVGRVTITIPAPDRAPPGRAADDAILTAILRAAAGAT